jgi:ubiquinone/menaquinone biosynthesis C-methylase UbiE
VKKKPVREGFPARKRKDPNPRKKTSDEKPATWDQVAAWYDALVGDSGSDYHKEVIMPGVYKLLDLDEKSKVLDLACGQGVFCRYLSKKRFSVHGVDVSKELIERARSRSDELIQYTLADATGDEFLNEISFDAVVCLLALQNIEKLESFFINVSRCLKPGGKFVAVVTHPCFRIPRQTHWGWDENKRMQYRRIDHYGTEIEIPIIAPPFSDPDRFTVTYHRPLQSYIQSLAKANLWVDGLEEWSSNKVSEPGKRSRAENRARKEIPLFMAFRARLAP